jgi:hypothetical protein
VSKRSKDKKRKYQWIEQLVWNFPEIKRLEGGRGPVKSLSVVKREGNTNEKQTCSPVSGNEEILCVPILVMKGDKLL